MNLVYNKSSYCLHYSAVTNVSCKHLFIVATIIHILYIQARANTANIIELKCMKKMKHKKAQIPE